MNDLTRLAVAREKELSTRALWFIVVMLVLSFGLVGTLDYNDAKAVEQEYVTAKKSRQSREQPARMWSKKCERQGKRIFATQADGKAWIIKCVDAKATT